MVQMPLELIFSIVYYSMVLAGNNALRYEVGGCIRSFNFMNLRFAWRSVIITILLLVRWGIYFLRMGDSILSCTTMQTHLAELNLTLLS